MVSDGGEGVRLKRVERKNHAAPLPSAKPTQVRK